MCGWLLLQWCVLANAQVVLWALAVPNVVPTALAQPLRVSSVLGAVISPNSLRTPASSAKIAVLDGVIAVALVLQWSAPEVGMREDRQIATLRLVVEVSTASRMKSGKLT